MIKSQIRFVSISRKVNITIGQCKYTIFNNKAEPLSLRRIITGFHNNLCGIDPCCVDVGYDPAPRITSGSAEKTDFINVVFRKR